MVNSVKSSPTAWTTRCVRPRETQEDPCPQGSSSLLGSPRARTTHEDDRTTWPHCWCLQEEGWLIFKTHSTIGIMSPQVVSTSSSLRAYFGFPTVSFFSASRELLIFVNR